MNKQPQILICPLDWGIGHATRCVPIIQELIRQGVNVYIGAAGRPMAFLKKEFPQLDFIDFPGHSVAYPSNEKGMVLKMASQLPQLFKTIRKERQHLDRLIDKYKLDGVISDNRFGVYSPRIPCVFMTHQVFIKVPSYLRFLESFIHWLNFKYISRFSEYWIPDVEGDNNLSGDLSHKKALSGKAYFIGPLSRFAQLHQNDDSGKSETKWEYDVLILLSGPEPQRSILEKLMLNQLKKLSIRAAIVQGKPEQGNSFSAEANPVLFPHLDTPALYRLIMQSKVVISRSGYSTLMDLASINKKAVFIPTPGQTEQEYLAAYHKQKGRFYCVAQQKLSLEEALKQSDKFTGYSMNFNFKALENRVGSFLEKTKTSGIQRSV